MTAKILSEIALSITLLFIMQGVSQSQNGRPESSRTDPARNPVTEVRFEGFRYSNQKQLKSHGWIVRTAAGWPGVAGATWSEAGVSFLKDANEPKNTILRMTSSTDGTAGNTHQTQICHQRKYL